MRAFLLVLVASCGFAPRPITAGGDDVMIDGPPVFHDAPQSDAALGPFMNVQPIAQLDSAGNEDDPTFTGDMLEVYFDGGGDIYYSVRTAVTETWAPPQPLVIVNSGYGETTSEITADGLELYFSSTRPGGFGGNDIYVSKRVDRMSPFGAPVAVTELDSNVEDVCPTPVGNGLVMYLSSNRAGTAGGYDLWRTTRPDRNTAWSTPVHVDDIASAATETEPWVNPAETVMYFSGDAAGGRDIWLATRSTAAAPWDPPALVPELNSPQTEEDPWLSPDGHTMVFASTRSGNYDLYMATR